VSYICEQIVEKLIPHLAKKVKDLTIKPFQVRAQFQIFVSCLIENPSFSSQTKDVLTSGVESFGSVYSVSDRMIKDMIKIGIAENILNQVRNKENNKIEKQLKKLKNSDSKLVIPKLEDANLAGKSNRCTLILTEGDSAKTLAMSGV
jgi:DNA topoisomerase-2